MAKNFLPEIPVLLLILLLRGSSRLALSSLFFLLDNFCFHVELLQVLQSHMLLPFVFSIENTYNLLLQYVMMFGRHVHGYQFYVIFIDNCTDFTLVYPFELKAHVKKQFTFPVNILSGLALRTDVGGRYTSHNLSNFWYCPSVIMPLSSSSKWCCWVHI